MQVSLKNYTLRHLSLAFLLIISVWAALFYAYILDEVYDNVDDGLKDQKIEILREIYKYPALLQTDQFGISQFRVLPAAGDDDFSEENKLSSEFFYMPYDDEQEPYRVLRTGFYAADKKPYLLEIRTSTVEEDDLMYDLTTALIVLYVVLVLGLYLVNVIVLRRAWSPFDVILQNLHHYRFTKKENLRAIHTNVIEFNKLDEEIRQMWQRNEDVFIEQKRFIENAAHELQTPLAITINRLELLMEDEALSENQLTQLSDTRVSLRRLVNLNKALLMLSRIENKQYTQVEPLNMNAITKAICDDLTDLFAYRNIKLDYVTQGELSISMNKDLAMVLLSNLLRNAIRHNKDGGTVSVVIQTQQLSIANTGALEALDSVGIFKRFQKGGQDSQSNGLGLAIVKSIVDSYPALKIDYGYAAEQHVFTLRAQV